MRLELPDPSGQLGCGKGFPRGRVRQTRCSDRFQETKTDSFCASVERRVYACKLSFAAGMASRLWMMCLSVDAVLKPKTDETNSNKTCNVGSRSYICCIITQSAEGRCIFLSLLSMRPLLLYASCCLSYSTSSLCLETCTSQKRNMERPRVAYQPDSDQSRHGRKQCWNWP